MPNRVEIDFEANTSEAASNIDRLNDRLDENSTAGKSLKQTWTEINSVMEIGKKVFNGVSAVMKSLIDPTVEYGQQVRDLSRAIGASSVEASKLIQAADDVFISTNSLTSALEAAIRKGVEPTVEGIAELADQYNAIQDPIARTKFLMDNFGRSGADLAPLMELGADGIRELGDAAEAAGLVLGDQAVQDIKEYQESMDTLNDAVLALKLSMVGVIPVLTSMLTEAAAGVTLVRLLANGVADGSISVDEFARALMLARTPVVGMQLAVEYLAGAMRDGKLDAEKMTTAIQGLRAEASTFGDRLATSTRDVYVSMSALQAGLSGGLTQAFEGYDKVLAETTPEIARLQGEIEKYTRMQGQSVTVTGAATTTNAEYELAAIKAAQAQQKLNEYTGDSREEYLQLVVAAEQAQERVVKLGEGMGTSETFTLNYTTKLAELNTELDANIAKNEAAALAMQESIAQFLYQQLAVEGDAKANLELARTLGIIDEASYNAATAAQELRDEYQKTGDLSNYRSETELLQQAIEKLRSRDITITVTTINRAINEIVETAAVIAEGEYYGDSNTGAADTSGDYYDAPGYEPGRAHGGPVRGGMPYWVGEHGPERFVPATDGQIVPAGETLPTVTIENFYGAPNMDVRAVAAQFSAALAAQLRGTVTSGAYRVGA